jgi:hypothetical protein
MMMTIVSYLLKLFRLIDYAASRLLPSMVSYREDIQELKRSVEIIEGKVDVLSAALQVFIREVKNDATTTIKRRTTPRAR